MNQYRFFDKFGNSYFFTVPKGIDGQSAEDYAENLEANLQSLLDRAKSGDHYKAPPVRRVFIPKGDGKSLRPLGIPTFEDKLLQRAVVMLLEPEPCRPTTRPSPH